MKLLPIYQRWWNKDAMWRDERSDADVARGWLYEPRFVDIMADTLNRDIPYTQDAIVYSPTFEAGANIAEPTSKCNGSMYSPGRGRRWLEVKEGQTAEEALYAFNVAEESRRGG